ncbi:MAG TPA: ABC transporter ATP-binding protein [Candidatus Mediterraneibacter pullistercoris]|nr:ABC transporter ATP-binding protein [Candidatus Mediterraneibacter pullistercoris]
MICTKNLVKTFDTARAVDGISLDIPEGIMFGLLGTNGAGKTTLLRLMAGILDPDSGDILVDGEELSAAAEKIFYLPDDPYYFPNATMEQMAEFYKSQYPDMDTGEAEYMAESLNLDVRQPLRTFSKGMKRQAFLILALCAGTKYLLCDEVFDGLDPIASDVMKNLFRQEMKERRFTVVVASHKLQELEDVCGNIAILHKGGLVTAGDMRVQAKDMCKFQCAFRFGDSGSAKDAQTVSKEMKIIADRIEKDLDIVRSTAEGSFITLVARGDKDKIREKLLDEGPAVLNEVPMSLEEIFIAELEVKGYDIRKVLH